MVKYSEQTKSELRRLYPLREDLFKKADAGDQILVSILDELSSDVITSKDICDAFESTRQEELRNLYERARIAQQKFILYGMAMDDFFESAKEEVFQEREASTDLSFNEHMGGDEA